MQAAWLRHLATGLATVLSCASSSAASPAVDQAMRLGGTDPSSAIAILKGAHEGGDLEAGAVLARLLFEAPEPHGNKRRACEIARQLVRAPPGAPQAEGWAVMASCLLSDAVSTPQHLEAARDSARRAVALGSAGGSAALFNAYLIDPRSVAPDTQADPVRRRLQSEAWTGLSFALDGKDARAADYAVGALYEAAAPGNIDRLLAAAALAREAAERRPLAVSTARRFKALGGTHAPLAVTSAAQTAARSAAAVGSVQLVGYSCDQLEIARTEPGPEPQGAAYLPIALGPLVNALLLAGQWRERWVYAGCGIEVPVQMAFQADGRGSANFEASAAPRSVVLQPRR